MSPEELTEACWRIRRRWNSKGSIFARMWDLKTHLSSPYRLGVYLKYNPIYGRESIKKQGMMFGLKREGIGPEQRGGVEGRKAG